jgi:SAM-dependent methyltransferase
MGAETINTISENKNDGDNKSDFFGEKYFSEKNYGVPKGYRAYDNDGFWKSAVTSMEKYGKNLESENYLDLGCAFGYLLKRSPFSNIYGADISRDPALEVAKNELKKEGKPYNTLVQLDANDNLPYNSNVFGCVTALDIIEHTKDRAHTVQEIARVMKDDGLLIVGVPITDTPEGRFWGAFLDMDKSHVSKPSRAELFTDLENSGFEVLEYRYYFPLINAKIPIPKTSMEVVVQKTNETPEQLRALHKERFPEANFLKKDTVEENP